MPYYAKKVGDKYCVYKKDGDTKVGCTAGNQQALKKYLGALHANANENSIWEEFKKDSLREEEDQNVYYFAYGSNMDIKEFEANYHTAKAVGLAYLDDWQLSFDKVAVRDDESAVADITKGYGTKVFGILYELDSSEYQKLDEQEGGYVKLSEMVYDGNDKKHKIFTYTVATKEPLDWPVPKIHYISKMIRGLKDAFIIGPKEATNELKIELLDYVEHIQNLYELAKIKND